MWLVEVGEKCSSVVMGSIKQGEKCDGKYMRLTPDAAMQGSIHELVAAV